MDTATPFRAPAPLSPRLGILFALAVAGLTLASYRPALRAGFIWDDDRYVTANPAVRADDGLRRIWLAAETRDYYPVTYTSFWLEWRLWGGAAGGYHAVNVLLHAANAVLLGFLLRGLGIRGGLLCGLLFAVHPVNVESVAWISQRKNLLAMLFFLLSALALSRWERTGRRVFYPLALLLFALSLMAKPVAAAFPLVIALFRWWQRRGTVLESAGLTIPFLALAALYGAVTMAFQQAYSMAGEAVGPSTAAGHLFAACRALAFYAGKTIWPRNLCPVYPEWNADAFSGPNLLCVAAAAALATVFLKYRRGWGRPCLFALGYYALMLLPVLGFFDVGFMFYAFVADHWVYAALPALLLPPAHALTRLADGSASARRGAVLAAAAAVAVLGLLAARQCRIYESKQSLFAAAARCNPRAWVAHLWLGNLAFDRGDLDEAERRYRETLRLRPGYWEAENGLGIVAARRGRLDEAIGLFRRVLARKPEHVIARRNLAAALADKARRAPAEREAPGGSRPARAATD